MELALPPEWDVDLPTDRPLTVDDYLRLPEGPPHFELIDGAITVNPQPTPAHARVAGRLFLALHRECPPHLEVFANPVDWAADEHNVLEPDLTVVHQADVGEKRLVGAPLLAIEILSPSTRRRDLTAKRAIYERGGVAAYWIIDPAGPRFVALELDARSGTYVERADLTGDGTFETTVPFPVAIDVAALVT